MLAAFAGPCYEAGRRRKPFESVAFLCLVLAARFARHDWALENRQCCSPKLAARHGRVPKKQRTLPAAPVPAEQLLHQRQVDERFSFIGPAPPDGAWTIKLLFFARRAALWVAAATSVVDSGVICKENYHEFFIF